MGEIKSSFPKYRAAVDQMVGQVRHYDGGLAGWEGGAPHGGSGRGGDHDIIIAVRAEHAPDFAVGLPAALKERGAEVKSPLSIIGIVRNKTGSGADWFSLKKLFGTISHKKANGALGSGWTIDAASLTNELNGTRFYDSRPPLPYVMSMLWAHVFPNLVHAKKLRRLRTGVKVHVDVEVGRVHHLAAGLAPSSNPGCVKRAWIKDSLEEFARIGLAERTGSDKYRIRYSTHESQLTECFARVTATKAGRSDGP